MSSATILNLISLDCDIPVPNVYAERGFYSDIFENLLNSAVKTENKSHGGSIPADLDVRVTRYDCMGGDLPSTRQLEGVQGIILTGSAFSAYDDVPWIHNLIAFVLEIYYDFPYIKIFGSCFGHQLVAHAIFSTPYSSVVYHDPTGWELGVQPITLTPPFLSHYGPVTSNPSSPSHSRLQLIHADHVLIPSSLMRKEGFKSIGRSERCAVQGIWKDGRVLTFQGHAEFDRFVIGETARFVGMDELSVESVMRDDDALWAAGVILRFFLEVKKTSSRVEMDARVRKDSLYRSKEKIRRDLIQV
ncbi:uncharacterized protein RAG0_04709 [Rhynchosporium agropyri]|uniref:Class I glutamine amidotransferase-like protein n=1 Tax=Rhynchosporium agropyri TaxID=914238 RepID=A0A1E1KA46_9HELO|nr:uncharacterized protein RAG0_04709 [Rhynchosporium agropyri]